MLRYIFVLFTLVVTVANAIILVENSLCVPGAETNPLTKKCECKDGLVGHPDLCCYSPALKGACYVAGDPYLVSYYGATMNMNFPCGSHVSSSYNNIGDKRCQVDVFTSSKHMDGASVFYTSNILVKVSWNGKTVSHMFNSQQNPLVAILTDASGDERTIRLGLGKMILFTPGFTEVTASYSPLMHHIAFQACGIEVNMRPVSDNNKNQVRAPGVCILHTKDEAQIDDSSMSMCSLRETDVSGGESYLKSAVLPMKSFSLETQPELQKVVDPATYDVCLKFSMYATNCQDESQRNYAFKHCAFLLFNADVRMCMWEIAPKVVKNSIVMDYFDECVSTLCQAAGGDKNICTDGTLGDPYIKKCAPSVMKSCLANAGTNAPPL